MDGEQQWSEREPSKVTSPLLHHFSSHPCLQLCHCNYAQPINCNNNNNNEKKHSETQTQCAKNVCPPQTPFLGAQDRQNLISWRWSVPAPTDPVWCDQCTQFRVIMVTDTTRLPVTNTHTDRTDYNILCR